VPFADKDRNSIPHAFVTSLEPENIDVPLGQALDVAHRESYVIDAFKLHEKL
jgi:hypothetical protein